MEDLIANNIGLVKHLLKRFNLLDDQDAESLGYEALGRACQNYDASMNTKLSTYAYTLIYNALAGHLRTLNKQRQLTIVSYNNIAYENEDGIHEHLDFLTTYETAEDSLIKKEEHRVLQQAYEALVDAEKNEVKKKLLIAWRVSDFEAGSTELAEFVGCSQSYASQTMSVFKNKLKKQMEVYYNGKSSRSY